MTEQFWEDLLTYIENGDVIPVVGQNAVTCGADDQPLHVWLAPRLAARLGQPVDELQAAPTLQQVVLRHLLEGGKPNEPYLRTHQILHKEIPSPGPTVRALASIASFKLYISATFDPLLEQSIDLERFDGAGRTSVGAFSPEAGESADIPARMRDLSAPHVHHILGRVSTKVDYVLWEEDALEFICALQQRLDKLNHLAQDLRERSLLLLGLSYSDWLVRFFLRTAKQKRLSRLDGELQYMAEGPRDSLDPGMVLYFDRLTKHISLIPASPAAFIVELATRWRARNPRTEDKKPLMDLPPARVLPPGAIFISYAREDEKIASEVKAGLERLGCVVWFDRERLKPGDKWHAHLEDAVKRDCGAFLSLISKTTESTREAYFHQERNWAADRTNRFADGEPFYFPVFIDEAVSPHSNREPHKTRGLQATRLVEGQIPPALAAQLREIQQKRTRSPP